VLYSGNFQSYQGVNELIEAIPQVISIVPEVVFLFVGLTSESDRIWSEKMREHHGETHIRVLPRQPREIAIKLLLLADVLVSPRTDNSNLPLKIFDYLAAGKPIVATDIASHRLVLDEDCAMFFRPSAPDELAERIILLLKDHEYAGNLSKSAHRRADDICSWRAFLQQIIQLHDQQLVIADRSSDQSLIMTNGTLADNDDGSVHN
jgi:glycosyltransferase involved in cell wall biosynthesis